ERENRRRIAIEKLNADRVSQRVYEHFLALSMASGPQGFYIEDAEKDYRFTIKGDIAEVWQKHRADFLPLLRDALPDHRIRTRETSILADKSAPAAGEQTFVFSTLEQIPEAYRKDARVLPNKSYLVKGDAGLVAALEGKTVDSNVPPIVPPITPPKAKGA